MKLSIVVPFYNGLKWNRHTFVILRNLKLDETQYIRLDDWSDSDVSISIRNVIDPVCCHYYYKNRENKWVTYSWNYWINVSSSEYVLVINNDIDITKEVIDRMIQWLQDEEVMLSCPHEIINWEYYHREDNINWACWMIRRKDWEKIWPIDERLKIFFNDDWLFKRITQDLWKRIDYFEEAIVHHCSKTVSWVDRIDEKTLRDRDEYIKICLEKWRQDKRFI